MFSKLLKKDRKGFTLIEMLIVVAIIVILVAIAIPTITAQLERAREAADIANIRSAYAEAMIDSLTSDDGKGSCTSEKMTQTTSGWKYATWPEYLGTSQAVVKGNTVTVSVDADGNVTCAVGSTTTQQSADQTQGG